MIFYIQQPKDEGWFLVLGDIEKKEVVALKRAGGIKRNSQQQIAFRTPDHEGIFLIRNLSTSLV